MEEIESDHKWDLRGRKTIVCEASRREVLVSQLSGNDRCDRSAIPKEFLNMKPTNPGHVLYAFKEARKMKKTALWLMQFRLWVEEC
jgi:hypothetical protein